MFSGNSAHTITATYNGSTNFAASPIATLIQTVGQVGTSTTLSGPVVVQWVYGQTVTYTAVVHNQSGGPAPTSGTVTFTVDGVSQTAVNVNSSSQATLNYTFLSTTPQTVTATYNGSTGFGSSTSTTLNQTVTAANTSLGLSSSVNPSIYGQGVASRDAGAWEALVYGTVTDGTVTFTVDNVTQTPVPVSSGAASFTMSTLSVGPHQITATYSGDPTNFKSSSTTTAWTQTVSQAPTSAAVSAAKPIAARPVRGPHRHDHCSVPQHGHTDRRHGDLCGGRGPPTEPGNADQRHRRLELHLLDRWPTPDFGHLQRQQQLRRQRSRPGADADGEPGFHHHHSSRACR